VQLDMCGSGAITGNVAAILGSRMTRSFVDAPQRAMR
jgi:hypothetical protein